MTIIPETDVYSSNNRFGEFDKSLYFIFGHPGRQSLGQAVDLGGRFRRSIRRYGPVTSWR